MIFISLVPATANMSIAAIVRREEKGAKDIRLVCMVAARMRGMHPNAPIWSAAVDEERDEDAYIVPGLGRRRPLRL